MIQPIDIEQSVDEIAEKFGPERIILFGAYAYGTPTEDSDVDLMIIRRYRGRSVDAAIRIRAGTTHRFPMDLLVRSPVEIRRRINWGDMFIIDVVENGIVLYDATNRRMGEQGRRRLRQRLTPAALAKA